MTQPFYTSGITTDDNILIDRALNGSKPALEDLIKKHQTWVFNVALNFAADGNQAADITQDVLVKVITNLKSFRKESQFRTWVYRIIKNHFLNMKRSQWEIMPLTFDFYGQGLDNTPDEDLSDYKFEAEEKMVVEEAKISCMKGMLLCLDREQRLIFLLGEMFGYSDTVGAEIMEISRENFRVKLHRAKKQLYNFMDKKCGLINKNNPCRCARKTAGFIKKGYVDPVHLHFQKGKIVEINKATPEKLTTIENEVFPKYRELYRTHPYLKSPESLEALRKLLSSDSIKKTFDFQ